MVKKSNSLQATKYLLKSKAKQRLSKSSMKQLHKSNLHGYKVTQYKNGN